LRRRSGPWDVSLNFLFAGVDTVDDISSGSVGTSVPRYVLLST
jgi:hypothetical protein